MQKHISAEAKVANFQMNTLRKLKPFLPVNDFKLAVQALVISRLEYGSATLWTPLIYNCPFKSITQLSGQAYHKLQKKLPHFT